ncbi:MAG TPA: hypothetical protein PK585_00075 [Amphiplicatus sp.]|nr:hypothetical protein [Amphiplicatus sp.]MCB9956140.1 hypothetical protein [Caulobacterales bacterium]HOP18447.1 hypothetical protein [Amphiplicatus sp.]
MRGQRILLGACAFLCLSIQMAEAYEPPETYIQGLVTSWIKRPEHRTALGFALSAAFVEWPEIFLRTLDQSPSVFSEWHHSICESTYQWMDASEPGRGPQTLEMVVGTAKNWQSEEYGALLVAIIHSAKRCDAKGEIVSH